MTANILEGVSTVATAILISVTWTAALGLLLIVWWQHLDNRRGAR